MANVKQLSRDFTCFFPVLYSPAPRTPNNSQAGRLCFLLIPEFLGSLRNGVQFEFSNKLLNSLFFLIYVPESGHISGDKTQTFKMTLADGNTCLVARGSISKYRHFCLFRELHHF